MTLHQHAQRLGLALLIASTIAAGHAFSAPAKIAPTSSRTAPAPPPAPLDQPRYFFSLDLDARYQFVGTGELTAEAAAISNCYWLTFQPDGKLQRIEYKRAGTEWPDSLFHAARIDFEYEPGFERRWYRDPEGQPAKTEQQIAGVELTLNAAGFPTVITNLGPTGKHVRNSSGVISYQRTLDKNFRLLAARRTGLLGTSITDDYGLFETRSGYDEQGRKILYQNFDSSGNLLDDKDGVATTRATYPDSTDSRQTIESYFDSTDTPAAKKSTGVHAVSTVLDPRGLLVDTAYFDVHNLPVLETDSDIHEIRLQYDDRGNVLSEAYFDIQGKPRNIVPFGFASVFYKYDARNLVIQKSFFGDDGMPQVLLKLGAAIVQQEYDQQGNMVRQQFFDGQGNPSLHAAYLAPAIRIKIEGENTVISLRDAHDQPMTHPVSGYASLHYNTLTDQPLTHNNRFFDLQNHPMSRFRVFVVRPHLYALSQAPFMRISAHYGAAFAAFGALLAMAVALHKSYYTRRRKVYVPTPLDRFLGWVAILSVIEGTIRFLNTIYWAWLNYQNARMGWFSYIVEGIIILFFLYRLPRMLVTMRVLNIEKDDIHRLVREYFAKAKLNPVWDEAQRTYVTEPLRVRIDYYQKKCHAYLHFNRHWDGGADLARGLDRYIRAHAGAIQGPVLTRALAFYYPCVAFAYFSLACLAFYTLWQMLKY